MPNFAGLMSVLDTEIRQNFSSRSYWPLPQSLPRTADDHRGSQREGQLSQGSGRGTMSRAVCSANDTLGKKDKGWGKVAKNADFVHFIANITPRMRAGRLLPSPRWESFLYSTSFYGRTRRIALGHRAATLLQLSVFRAICARETGFNRMEGDVPSQVSLNEFASNARRP